VPAIASPASAPAELPGDAFGAAGGIASAAHRALGMTVLERGWLSANQAVFDGNRVTPATVVDTGFSAHAEQTLALVDHALAGQSLGRIVNTHLQRCAASAWRRRDLDSVIQHGRCPALG
jgi:hypothetical protein